MTSALQRILSHSSSFRRNVPDVIQLFNKRILLRENCSFRLLRVRLVQRTDPKSGIHASQNCMAEAQQELELSLGAATQNQRLRCCALRTQSRNSQCGKLAPSVTTEASQRHPTEVGTGILNLRFVTDTFLAGRRLESKRCSKIDRVILQDTAQRS